MHCSAGVAAAAAPLQPRMTSVNDYDDGMTPLQVLEAYVAIWSERDATKRAALAAASLAPAAVILGPGYRLAGPDAACADAERFQREHPAWRARATSGFDLHSGWARFAIAVDEGDGGRCIAEGWDVARFAADGRIELVVTFWGALPPR